MCYLQSINESKLTRIHSRSGMGRDALKKAELYYSCWTRRE